MVSLLAATLNALDRRKRRILLVAQSALPPAQFEAYRKIVLDEFGKSGLQSELEEAFRRHDGKARNGKAPDDELR